MCTDALHWATDLPMTCGQTWHEFPHALPRVAQQSSWSVVISLNGAKHWLEDKLTRLKHGPLRIWRASVWASCAAERQGTGKKIILCLFLIQNSDYFVDMWSLTEASIHDINRGYAHPSMAPNWGFGRSNQISTSDGRQMMSVML